jgi:hypothetical protein
MTAVLLVTAVFIALGGGFLFGRLSRRPLLQQPPRSSPPSATCGCGHHYAFHEVRNGMCRHGVAGNATHWNGNRMADAWARERCQCQRYAGPLSVDTVFAPEIGE